MAALATHHAYADKHHMPLSIEIRAGHTADLLLSTAPAMDPPRSELSTERL
jgi:hypothetical protein